jgi:hypothetical protein
MNDERHEMQAKETPTMGARAQEAEPKQPRTKGPSVLLWIGVVLSSAAVLIGCCGIVAGFAFLIIPPKPYDYHGFSKLFAFVCFAFGLIVLPLGAIGLNVCLKRLSRKKWAKRLLLAAGGVSLLLIVAMVVVVQGQRMTPERLLRQYEHGKRDFREVELPGAELSGAILSGVNLSGAFLDGANLNKAKLNGADLSGAYLDRADLSGADLTEADLILAGLPEADLSWANLHRANLSGANLLEADLRGADLSEANVTPGQLAQAKTLEGATMPDGTVHE